MKTAIEQPKRKWQFLKYGDDALMLSDRCYIKNCRECKKNPNQFYTWRIPARTVKILYPITRPEGGTRSVISTINFKAGCNLYRAKLLKDIYKAQKSKALPTYKNPKYMPAYYNCYEEESIELLVDGQSVANINGNYKQGMIKEALKPYTTKARVGKRSVTWDFGEADRVTA